jgi:hypothetical protein
LIIEESEFKSWQGQEISLFSTSSRLDMGPQFEWKYGTLVTGAKPLVEEDVLLFQSSADVENAWSYTSIPHTSSWHDVQLNIGTTFTTFIKSL